jgi:primosomal protein N' (replication factor Y)
LPSWLSPKLFSEIKKTLEQKEQTALFLNRRGFAQFVICSGCGFVEQCNQCSVTLTVHGRGKMLECHYCGFRKPCPLICPSCKIVSLKPLGLGTEKIAEELQNIFPEARIARADRDEINSRESLEALLSKIQKHEIDIIVGTQMIAKGHDFPNLTLVGAVAADVGLHMPDFRSSERTFQLLTQVAGRAGRHQKAGRVLIQTYVPNHPAIHFATTHDYRSFATQELKTRQELMYPPYGRLATVRLQGVSLDRVENDAQATRDRLGRLQNLKEEYRSVEILGPCEAPLAKLKGKHRYHLLLKSPSSQVLNAFLQHLMQDLEWLSAGVRLSVDVDPLQLL